VNKVLIDTNILVRYFTNDIPEKAAAVKKLLLKAKNNEIIIVIQSIIIAELIWVFESFYKLKKEKIVNVINALLNTPGIDIINKSTILKAIEIYSSKNVDYIDANVMAFAIINNINTVITFDKKHFKSDNNITILNPGNI